MMQNVRNIRLGEHVRSWGGRDGGKHLIASQNFHSRYVFSKNLMAIELKKCKVVLNEPIYIGKAILEISKVCLYDFHYGFMLKDFSSEICKFFADSLFYEIKHINPYDEHINPY